MKLDTLELLEELVAIDSQNPGVGEIELARYVDDLARSLGFDSELVETEPGRGNVLITVDAGGSRSLILSGHLDTKAMGETEAEWNTPPLEVIVQENLAYGLGTSDMKGAVAAMFVAAQKWSESSETGRLSLVFTADEESGSRHGAQALCERELVEADAALIGEPSGIDFPWEAMYLVSRGICRFYIVVDGEQGHSGLSGRLATSATVAAARALLAIDKDLEPAFDPHPDCDYGPTINAGVLIEGGGSYGVHPGHAAVKCDVRLVPGTSREELEEEIRSTVTKAMPRDVNWSIRYPQDITAWKDPVSISPHHELVLAAQDACVRVLGKELPFGAYPGGTDATAFTSLSGIPAVASLGPGWLSVAHSPNECVGLDQLHDAVDIYEHTARNYLQSAS